MLQYQKCAQSKVRREEIFLRLILCMQISLIAPLVFSLLLGLSSSVGIALAFVGIETALAAMLYHRFEPAFPYMVAVLVIQPIFVPLVEYWKRIDSIAPSR
jgi:hypothetical protein